MIPKYDRKYRASVESKEPREVHEEINGAICYPAYFKEGERGLFLFETNDIFTPIHRLQTSKVMRVEYFNNGLTIDTENTRYIFELCDDEENERDN